MKKRANNSYPSQKQVKLLIEKFSHLRVAAQESVENNLLQKYDNIGVTLKKEEDVLALCKNTSSVINTDEFKKSLLLSKINLVKENDYINEDLIVFSKEQIADIKQKAIEIVEDVDLQSIKPKEILDKLLTSRVKSNTEFVKYVEKNFAEQKKYRLGKTSSAQRTAVLAFDSNGNYTLVLMHNSKLAHDTNEKNYQAAKLGSGTCKNVKRSVDLIKLIADSNSDADLARASMILKPASTRSCINEIQLLISKFVDAQYVVVPKYFSAPFIREKANEKQVVIYVFYELALCSLCNLFENPELFLALDEHTQYCKLLGGETNEIPEFLKFLMMDMVRGIKEVHDRGFAHQDIKIQNILLFRGDRLYAKISDFSLTAAAGDPAVMSLYSRETAPPEIYAIHDRIKTSYYADLPDKKYHGREVFKKSANVDKLIANGNSPDKKSDIWALGIVFYLLLTRSLKPLTGEVDDKERERIATLKEKYPFLKRTIEEIPQNRANIDEVLDLLQQSFYPSSSNSDSKKMKI